MQNYLLIDPISHELLVVVEDAVKEDDEDVAVDYLPLIKLFFRFFFVLTVSFLRTAKSASRSGKNNEADRTGPCKSIRVRNSNLQANARL